VTVNKHHFTRQFSQYSDLRLNRFPIQTPMAQVLILVPVASYLFLTEIHDCLSTHCMVHCSKGV